jgi:hypothetical protein
MDFHDKLRTLSPEFGTGLASGNYPAVTPPGVAAFLALV